jgi:hypothetical protein
MQVFLSRIFSDVRVVISFNFAFNYGKRLRTCSNSIAVAVNR